MLPFSWSKARPTDNKRDQGNTKKDLQDKGNQSIYTHRLFTPQGTTERNTVPVISFCPI